MRTILIAIPALLAAACGQAAPPAEPAPDAPVAAEAPAPPTGEPMATGLMGGISTSATGDVSGLTINRDGLAFSNLEDSETLVATEFLGVVGVESLIAAGGESFAAAASSSTVTRVELRRIVGAAPQALCGGMAATHVAIVSTEPLTGLFIMVFTGADPPGPNARDTAICAIYGYAVD